MRSAGRQINAVAIAAIPDPHHQRPVAVGDANPSVARQEWMRRRHLPVAVGAAAVVRAAMKPAIVNSGRHGPAVGWCGEHRQHQE